MSAYLAYSYSSCLEEKEQREIDQQVQKCQKEFCEGASDSLKLCLTIYSIYSLTTKSAYASDQCPKPGSTPSNSVQKPQPKPGFKPLTRRQKGGVASAAGTICSIALATGDYLLGGACVMLVFIFLNVMNRP